MDNNAKVSRLVAIAGSPAKLAELLGEWPQNIHNWRKRGIPPEKCARIEAATGVRCEELRSDLTWLRDDDGAVTGYIVPVQAA